MNRCLLFLSLFHLFSDSSCIYAKAGKPNHFFGGDYRYFSLTEKFYKFHTTPRDWPAAKQVCANEGAFLWYPENQAEVNEMVDFWKEKMPSEPKLHVGISDIRSEGHFETIHGKPVETVWHHWGQGEPNSGHSEGEDCTVVIRNDNAPELLDLNDYFCKLSYPFICKKAYLTSEAENKFFRKDYRYYAFTRSFYKFHTTHRQWLDAKKRCTLEGASLWFGENQDEVNTMVDFWNEKLPAERILHVGISDILSEGNFETLDGRPVEEVWHHWGNGEPNSGHHEGEDCTVIIKNDNAPELVDLNDYFCKLSYPFICKKTLASIEWNVLCDMPDQSYIFERTLGKCYKLHRRPLNWREAHNVCAAEQSYLAVINNKSERDFLVRFSKEADIEKNPRGLKFVHLGFHNRFGEGWQTVTGIALDQSGWNDWEKGQPDGESNEQCGAMSLNGHYNDVNCDNQAFFICEHDISQLSNAIDERLGDNL